MTEYIHHYNRPMSHLYLSWCIKIYYLCNSTPTCTCTCTCMCACMSGVHVCLEYNADAYQQTFFNASYANMRHVSLASGSEPTSLAWPPYPTPSRARRRGPTRRSLFRMHACAGTARLDSQCRVHMYVSVTIIN